MNTFQNFKSLKNQFSWQVFACCLLLVYQIIVPVALTEHFWYVVKHQSRQQLIHFSTDPMGVFSLLTVTSAFQLRLLKQRITYVWCENIEMTEKELQKAQKTLQNIIYRVYLAYATFGSGKQLFLICLSVSVQVWPYPTESNRYKSGNSLLKEF